MIGLVAGYVTCTPCFNEHTFVCTSISSNQISHGMDKLRVLKLFHWRLMT
jgi:uncharacterized membrane protein